MESSRKYYSTNFASNATSPKKTRSKYKMFASSSNVNNNPNAMSTSDAKDIKLLKKEVLQFKQKA